MQRPCLKASVDRRGLYTSVLIHSTFISLSVSCALFISPPLRFFSCSCRIPVYLSLSPSLFSFRCVHTMCSGQQSVCLCVLRNVSPLVPLRHSFFFFFFSSVCNGPNVTLRLCPGQSLHTSTSGSPHAVKKVQKNFKNNYASVECGAKILSANSEAKVRHTNACTTQVISAGGCNLENWCLCLSIKFSTWDVWST